MLQRQFYKTREDGVNLYITFSDEGMMIEKKSSARQQRNRKALYKIAIDVESANVEYAETAVSATSSLINHMDSL